MKFLTIGKAKEANAVPPAALLKILEATLAYQKQQKKARKLLENYYVPGWGRSIAITENDSAEEFLEMLSGNPVYGLMDFEVYPLADMSESNKILVDSVKKAAKMMPGSPL
jgi:muconolactone delta-isomerase